MTSSGNKQKEPKKAKKYGRKENKENKPVTKVIVRRLPSRLKEEEFREAIDPIPENNYFRYVPANEVTGAHSFST